MSTGWKKNGSPPNCPYTTFDNISTAQRWAQNGLPFLRDHSGRPMAMKSHLDAYIMKMNQHNYNIKNWQDKGIGKALEYENEKAKQK